MIVDELNVKDRPDLTSKNAQRRLIRRRSPQKQTPRPRKNEILKFLKVRGRLFRRHEARQRQILLLKGRTLYWRLVRKQKAWQGPVFLQKRMHIHRRLRGQQEAWEGENRRTQPKLLRGYHLQIDSGTFFMNNKDEKGVYYDAANKKKYELMYDNGKLINQAEISLETAE